MERLLTRTTLRSKCSQDALKMAICAWSEDPNVWVVASRAVNRMTGDAPCLIDPVLTNIVCRGVGGTVTATAMGSIRLLVKNCNRHTSLHLPNVVMVSGQPWNLISTERLKLENCYCSNKWELPCLDHYDNGCSPVASVYSRHGVPYVDTVQDGEQATAAQRKSKYGKVETQMIESKQRAEKLEAELQHVQAELAQEKERVESFARQRTKIWL